MTLLPPLWNLPTRRPVLSQCIALAVVPAFLSSAACCAWIWRLTCLACSATLCTAARVTSSARGNRQQEGKRA
eukprot:544842-Rhodomonas_salina.5